ncbi:hypothetical protein RGCCGE502_31457 (plasmid) [Rhizobium grahamii CCGE 502]|uniref:Thiamine pyrophosphate enzyme TPP-binding domain-containing protein n=1 Tax=Rhizobium grahamii CCGE 502 TaxID=990285 RepID=S3HLN3_9HYPH|nr:hypothetical protein RGCCGE502_31457 [Rhizobium grahamii CCGE 502]
MYTIQGLWTQARENLDVVTIIFANRAYAILNAEMRNVGVGPIGTNARRMLNLDNPAWNWVAVARGMGVEAARAHPSRSSAISSTTRCCAAVRFLLRQKRQKNDAADAEVVVIAARQPEMRFVEPKT